MQRQCCTRCQQVAVEFAVTVFVKAVASDNNNNNNEWFVEGDDNCNCDQMLELQEAQFLQRLPKNLPLLFLKSYAYHSSIASCRNNWATFLGKFAPNNFQNCPCLVTLSTTTFTTMTTANCDVCENVANVYLIKAFRTTGLPD